MKPVGILLFTHGRQGESLLESVSHTFGEWPDNVVAVSLMGTERRSEIKSQGEDLVKKLLANCGNVLILTDLYGSTQATIAEDIAVKTPAVRCVHGVNLSMALEAVAMRNLPLDALQKNIINAAKKAIIGSAAAKKNG